MDTITQLAQLIHDKFEIDMSILQPDLSLSEYGLDSLSLAELLFTVEDYFDISFPDRPQNIDTLARLAALIDEMRASQKV